jgi:hypothetical protein
MSASGIAGPSLCHGRVPPADVADPDRIPGFVGVLDHAGLVGAATNVQIAEQKTDRSLPLAGAPSTITVTARSSALDLTLTFSTDRAVRTSLAMTGGATDFVQMGGTYRIEGRADSRSIDVTARGAAETFQEAPVRVMRSSPELRGLESLSRRGQSTTRLMPNRGRSYRAGDFSETRTSATANDDPQWSCKDMERMRPCSRHRL